MQPQNVGKDQAVMPTVGWTPSFDRNATLNMGRTKASVLRIRQTVSLPTIRIAAGLDVRVAFSGGMR